MTWTGNLTVREGRIKPLSELPPMTREEAVRQYAALVRNFGWPSLWTREKVESKAPWEMLARCDAVLTDEDKRAALGQLRKPYP
jgi:hypothetical protein